MNLGQYLGAGSGISKGLWHLDGNSNDVSGNARNGTDTNITYSLANGKFGQGAGFNGTSSHIHIGTGNAITGGTPRTIVAWVKPSVVTGPMSIRSWGAVVASQYCSLGIGESASGDCYLAFYDNDYVSAGSLVVTGVWQCIIGIYDGGTLSTSTVHVYLNGIARTVSKVGGGSGAANTSDNNHAIGYYRAGNSQRYNGAVGEVFEENVAWSATQVQRYFTSRVRGLALLQ